MRTVNFNHRTLILFLSLFSTWNLVWAAGGIHDAKPGCETIRVFNHRLFPDDFGGSSIGNAKKYCNGKNDIYILELGAHAKCELHTSKVTLGVDRGYIDFEYEYLFKPNLGNQKYEVLDYCMSKSSKVEKFRKSEIPNETQTKIASDLTKPPYKYKITKQKFGTNFQNPWTYFSSDIGTQVIYAVVVNSRFKSEEIDILPLLKRGDSSSETLMSERENVLGGVNVAIMSGTALTTSPCSYSQTCSTFRTTGG